MVNIFGDLNGNELNYVTIPVKRNKQLDKRLYNANNFSLFFNYKKLIEENKFCIVERKGFGLLKDNELLKNDDNIILKNQDIIPMISSSEIRSNLDSNKNFLNQNVYNYIVKNKLYGNS